MILNKQVISALRNAYGDAFYLLDSKQFRQNYMELRSAFRKIYPNFNIAYSYKTNYIPRLCKIVNELGGYAEVVSDMELEVALRSGVSAGRVIWNGPVKNVQKLESFLLAGGTDNVDCLEELEVVRRIARQHPDKQLNVGIRCNYNVGDGVLSRFGFDVDSVDFSEAVRFVTTTPNVHFINLQCHFAKRQIDYWPARAEGMVKIIERLGVVFGRIDIGGGLFGKMAPSLQSQFSSTIPDYKAYAEAAATVFARYFADKDVKPELIIEPGSALVGDCMKFVATVETIKCVRGKWLATVLGSQKNISMSGINPPIEIIAMGGAQKEYHDLDFVGFTCIEGDVLHHNYNGPLAHGDALVIGNCGSYSLVMKPPFILPNFAVLDISEGQTEVIKRAETFDDLFHTFNF